MEELEKSCYQSPARVETVKDVLGWELQLWKKQEETPQPLSLPIMPSTGEPCWQSARKSEAGSVQKSPSRARHRAAGGGSEHSKEKLSRTGDCGDREHFPF